jgi:1-acyl-sn-glycerol-3-phosphate acyltransferase
MRLAEAPFVYRLMQRVLWLLFETLTRLDLQGQENTPVSGPLIVSPNHLHSFDIPLTGMAVPRHTTIMAGEKWQGKPGGKVMELFTNVIYVQRGEPDRAALAKGMAVLRAGGTLAVAPEGTRSHTGGLQEGKDGAAYLASRTGAVILPVVVWGHENALPALRRFRRADVHIRILPPVVPPPDFERARSPQLREVTEQLMLKMAQAMPGQYRGVYAERVSQGEAGEQR